MTKNTIPTADALVAELAGVTDWPKMARAFSSAIGTIRAMEQEMITLQAKIGELQSRARLAHMASERVRINALEKIAELERRLAHAHQAGAA